MKNESETLRIYYLSSQYDEWTSNSKKQGYPTPRCLQCPQYICFRSLSTHGVRRGSSSVRATWVLLIRNNSCKIYSTLPQPDRLWWLFTYRYYHIFHTYQPVIIFKNVFYEIVPFGEFFPSFDTPEPEANRPFFRGILRLLAAVSRSC